MQGVTEDTEHTEVEETLKNAVLFSVPCVFSVLSVAHFVGGF